MQICIFLTICDHNRKSCREYIGTPWMIGALSRNASFQRTTLALQAPWLILPAVIRVCQGAGRFNRELNDRR
jgi:hypothetical protein